MQVRGYGLTDSGRRCGVNEDVLFADDELGLYIVCDGMGGHAAGEAAAKIAVESVVSFLEERFEEINQAAVSFKPVPRIVSLVREAIQYACRNVYSWTDEKKSAKGSGTTLTLLLIYGRYAVVGHVGDSRLYLLRSGTIHQLTHDHTMIQDMIDRGGLPPEAARNHPMAHVLCRAVGVMESVQVDTLNLEILPADKFLLCTDGISSVLSDRDLETLLIRHQSAEAPHKLLEAALSAKSLDNLSALVVEVTTPEQELIAEQQRAKETQLKISMLTNMYLFRELSLQEIVRFVNLSEVVISKKGQCLFKEGQHDNSLYVILQGKLQVISGNTVVAELGPGSHVGEMAWLTGEPRSASVTVIESGKLLRIKGEEFEALVYAEPVTGVRLLRELGRELARRLASSNQLAPYVS